MKSLKLTKEISPIPIGKIPMLIRCVSVLLFFIGGACFLSSEEPLPRERRALLSLGAGIFNVLREHQRSVQVQVEYKWKNAWQGVQPFAAFMVTQKGSVYVCGGACYDIFLGKFFVLTPAFAPGLYFKGGGKDLGFPLEFRSSIAVAIEFPKHQRLGAQFYHISNAKLGSKNPGEESLVFFYGISF